MHDSPSTVCTYPQGERITWLVGHAMRQIRGSVASQVSMATGLLDEVESRLSGSGRRLGVLPYNRLMRVGDVMHVMATHWVFVYNGDSCGHRPFLTNDPRDGQILSNHGRWKEATWILLAMQHGHLPPGSETATGKFKRPKYS